MTNKVYIGAISPEGEHLLNAYLTKFLPDAEVEPLKPAGIKGKMRNRGARADVALIILDEALWSQCEGAVDDVLNMSKTHKYIDDDGLKQFLIARFGVVDIFADSGTIVPEDYIDAPDLPEMNTSRSYVPADNIVHTVSDDDIDMSTDYEEEQDTSARDSEVIAELRDKLASSEMLVRNLTQQLQDEKDDSEVKEFILRIRELEEQLAAKEEELRNQSSEDYINIGKVAKAERIISKVDSLEKQIKELGEAKAELEYEKTKLAGEIELYEGQIDELKLQVAEIEPLRNQVAERDESIKSLEKQVEDTSNALTEKESELRVLQSRVDEIGCVSNELTQTREGLAQKEIEFNNLKIDYDEREKEIISLKENIGTLEVRIYELDTMIADKDAELENLRSEIDGLDSEKSEQLGVVDSLKAEIEQLNSDIEGYKETISLLQEDSEKLSHKDAEINMLNANILEQRTLITNLNTQLSSQSETMQSKIDELSASADDVGSKYDSLIEEHNSLKEQYDESSARNEELESKVAELSDSLKERNEQLQSSTEQSKQDNIKIAKLEAQIETLQDSLIDAGADEETINRLNADLLEERRKSAKLQSQIDVMRKNDDSEKSDELRLEINRLRKELEDAKSADIQPDTEQMNALQTELTNARERIADLEMSLSEQTETISDISSSIFSKLSTFAFMPKAAVNVGLAQVPCVDDRFYFVTSGSAESVSSLYDVIRRVCVVNTNVHYLFVDLDSNSFVDSAFGTRKVESPLQWLEGKRDFRECITPTRFSNVKVLSAGFSYVNDLFYLNVDWKYRLEELKGYADVVVINIGCLNNFVTRLLFNTFNVNYKTIVVTKSAPINLRATSLELSGLLVNPNPNVTVECVDFDMRTSNNMYQRLASKYNTHILRDNDVLKL